MTKREVFIDYVKNGGNCICSPQIGAGAGFDTKLAGKVWISDTTFEDTLSAVEKFDIVPLINVGVPNMDCGNEKLKFSSKELSRTEKTITRESWLDTPYGRLYSKSAEEKGNAPFNLKYLVTEEKDLDMLEYYIDELTETDMKPITEGVAELVRIIDGRGALSIQWAMQPYELFGFPNTVDTLLLSIDCEERFFKIMDKIVKLDFKLIDAVARGGADFVFLGGPGSELISPYQYENFLVPYSKIVTEEVHKKGLMVYSHICSPIEPMLTKGYYNEMGIDLFETLSPPPVGNIKSFSDALSKIDPKICTRGNIGLDVLVNSTPEKIKEESFKILEAAKGRKHILAASDYMFAQVPEENVHAMCEAVKEFYK